jgi:hypothetical protein
MTFSGFDNMIITRKNSFSYQKITRILTSETIPADNLKIEIPINKIKSATYNKDNKVNKLVTVFALLHLDKFVITDKYNIQNNFSNGRLTQTSSRTRRGKYRAILSLPPG